MKVKCLVEVFVSLKCVSVQVTGELRSGTGPIAYALPKADMRSKRASAGNKGKWCLDVFYFDSRSTLS